MAKHRGHATHVAMHHRHATHVAMHHKGTHAMGAGAAPMTDVQAASRQARIDQAYDNWQAKRR